MIERSGSTNNLKWVTCYCKKFNSKDVLLLMIDIGLCVALSCTMHRKYALCVEYDDYNGSKSEITYNTAVE